MHLTIRTATIADLELVFDWANDPVTRSVSFYRAEISHEDHVAWFSKKLDSDDCLMFIVEGDGVPCAFIRLEPDVELGDAVIGINVAPSFRGQGLGSKALDTVNEVAAKHNYQRIVALIRPDNVASLKVFERAGYSFVNHRMINEISAHCFIRPLN